MKRRDFLKNSSLSVAALAGPRSAVAAHRGDGAGNSGGNSKLGFPEASERPKDYKRGPFKRLVILGESTVQGGPWLERQEDRYADVLVRLINACQKEPLEYHNKGIQPTPFRHVAQAMRNPPNPALWNVITRM